MGIETEIKMRVDDLGVIRERLAGAGATSRGERFELNAFFDTADRALKTQGRGLRLRSMTNAAGAIAHVITLKGPRSAGEVSSREEIEFAVGGFDDAALLLDRLGYRPTLAFEKRRETWALAGCLVELDTLPHLGTFVEIEGNDEAGVLATRTALGLDAVALVRKGYLSMIDALVRERPEHGTTVRF